VAVWRSVNVAVRVGDLAVRNSELWGSQLEMRQDGIEGDIAGGLQIAGGSWPVGEG
jgi:hypothetical protein